ncbi:hypothetical protein QGM71_12415 [Virgibacillus sp. C22-A2]|uniref:Swt1-like HEPN domain-containing protein n=1 Tax=Virgibacillus tibetensis TaxID=3042313 RepID=A0ABU6KG58_9BACI|nr:hypothetical protein [Virgibacillus sp. C22-A2]
MIAEKDIKMMQTAYGILFEVENCMRIYIRDKMEECYGIHWFHRAPRIVLKRPPKKSFGDLLFSDYATYFRNYPDAFKNLPSDFFVKLQELYPLRNKIAHNHLLSESKFELLEQNSTFLINSMTNKHQRLLVTS